MSVNLRSFCHRSVMVHRNCHLYHAHYLRQDILVSVYDVILATKSEQNY